MASVVTPEEEVDIGICNIIEQFDEADRACYFESIVLNRNP